MRLPYDDRRRSQRNWVAISVTVRSNGARIAGVTLNVSDHGMYVFAAANLTIGSTVEVEYQSPSSNEPVRAEAVVRRKAVYLYAIEFVGLDSVDGDSASHLQRSGSGNQGGSRGEALAGRS